MQSRWWVQVHAGKLQHYSLLEGECYNGAMFPTHTNDAAMGDSPLAITFYVAVLVCS